MTKNKRFSMTETELIFMVLDNGNALSRKEIIDTLNDLNDENEHLKEIMGIMPNDNVNDIVNVLNLQERVKRKLQKENEQLKKEYQKLKYRHSLLHDVCVDAECDRDSYQKDVSSLEKENEQLKIKNRGLQSELEIQKADIYHANKICNELFDENKELKEILKHTYEVHECETCKHNQNFNWLDPATMKREYDSKCGKGLHYGEEVHGCKEYELDLEKFKKRIWG